MKKIILSLTALLLVGFVLQADQETKVQKASEKDILKAGIGTVQSVISSVKAFKAMPDTAKELLAKMNCISTPGGTCKCSDEKACISQFMLALGDFLNELNLSLFGKLEGKTITEQGPLLRLTNLIKTGYAYREKASPAIDKLNGNILSMASRIQSSIEFLQLLGFMMDPMGTLTNQTTDQKKLIKEEPIKVEEQDLGALDL